MTPLPSNAELMAARFSTLDAQPSSEACQELCDKLLLKLMHQSSRRPRAEKRRAFAALIADLLERDPNDHGGWLYRILSPNEFTGELVGYRPVKDLLPMMGGLMIEFVPGTRQYTRSEFTGGVRQAAWGRAARFRATQWLRNWFEEQGISRQVWGDHFARIKRTSRPNQSSVTLRSNKRTRGGKSDVGRSMPVDMKDPTVAAIRDRMDKLNAFLWEQQIKPYGPVFLRRIFSKGDQPGFRWETGGRLTALGRDSFQTAKKQDRASILINGQETVEIDIQASHLTILVGLGILPEATLEGDPYEVEGIPRELVKQWIVMTLGYGRRHARWKPEVRRSFMEKHGIDLSREFPVRQTGDKILIKLPILGADGLETPVDWGLLQYLESEALMKTLEALAYGHQVASLPVHDSLIVPTEKKELAHALLKASFKETVGVEPRITERGLERTRLDS